MDARYSTVATVANLAEAYGLDPFVPLSEGAKLLGVSPGTVRKFPDRFPPRVFLNSRRSGFRLSELRAFLTAKTTPQ